MANEQHIAWLLEGVEAWNARRKREDFVPDLSLLRDFAKRLIDAGFVTETGRADLRGIDLSNANLTGSELEKANFRQAILIKANLSGADLAGAKFRHAELMGASLKNTNLRGCNLRNATLDGADLAGAKLYGANVRTIVLWDLAGGRRVQSTNLSTQRGLSQAQIETMRGDRGVILPEGLTYPDHWPEPEPPGADGALGEHRQAAYGAGPYRGHQHLDSEPTSIGNRAPASLGALVSRVRARSPSEIREDLKSNFPEKRAMVAFVTEQLQSEIAAHRMQPIPNEPEALSDYHARLDVLQQALTAVVMLYSALPAEAPSDMSDAAVGTLRDRLVSVAKAADTAVAYLDAHAGTYGNLWKIGLIGSCTGILTAFGVSAAVAAPIAAGVVGVSTFRFIVERRADKDDR